jgi:thioredoxin 1
MKVVQNNEIIINKDKVTILYFSATWCGPCNILKPVIEEVSKEMSDSVDINYIDINLNMGLSGEYEIMSVPTLIFLKEGEIKNRITGLQPKTNIIHAINNIK